MKSVRFARLVAAVVSLAVLVAPATAGAQGDDTPAPDPADIDLYWQMMVHVVDELAYYSVLDRVVEPVPELVDALPRRVGIGDAPTSVYQDMVNRLERIEGPTLLEEIAARGVAISARTGDVLRTGVLDQVDAEDYLAAYDDAMWQWWHAGGRDYGVEAAPLGLDRTPGWFNGDDPPPVLEPVVLSSEAPDSQSETAEPETEEPGGDEPATDPVEPPEVEPGFAPSEPVEADPVLPPSEPVEAERVLAPSEPVEAEPTGSFIPNATSVEPDRRSTGVVVAIVAGAIGLGLAIILVSRTRRSARRSPVSTRREAPELWATVLEDLRDLHAHDVVGGAHHTALARRVGDVDVAARKAPDLLDHEPATPGIRFGVHDISDREVEDPHCGNPDECALHGALLSALGC